MGFCLKQKNLYFKELSSSEKTAVLVPEKGKEMVRFMFHANLQYYNKTSDFLATILQSCPFPGKNN